MFMERLGKEHPDSFHIKGVTRKWAEEQGKLCRIHFKEGRLDEARAVLISLAEKDWLFQDTRLLNDYQAALVAAWNQAGTNSSTGQKWLLQAAEVWGQANVDSPLIQALRQSKLEGKQMIQLAEAQAKANPFRAIPFYQAALLRLNDGGRPVVDQPTQSVAPGARRSPITTLRPVPLKPASMNSQDHSEAPPAANIASHANRPAPVSSALTSEPAQ